MVRNKTCWSGFYALAYLFKFVGIVVGSEDRRGAFVVWSVAKAMEEITLVVTKSKTTKTHRNEPCIEATEDSQVSTSSDSTIPTDR